MIGTAILEERESKYNGHLRVARSLGFGTYIQADGLTQSGGIVGTIWKPTLKQINKLTNQPINNVLILGLGGGTVAKYIRLYWPEAKIMGIDIDPMMIELGKKYLGLGEVGVDIEIGDALKEIIKLKAKDQKFDLIIIDLYQGDKFPEKFESDAFLKKIRLLLSRGGMALFNRLSFGNKKTELEKFGLRLKKVFAHVEYFYPEVNVIFICTT